MLYYTETNYITINEIRNALLNRTVTGALIDVYVAADQKHRLFDKSIHVQKILDERIGYGVVLSGIAAVLQKRCNDFVKQNVEEIVDYIEKNTDILEVKNI